MQAFPFRIEFIEPNESMGFNRIDLDYWKTPEKFLNLLSGIPNTKSASKQIEARLHFSHRKEITSILRKQYLHYNSNSNVFSGILIICGNPKVPSVVMRI